MKNVRDNIKNLRRSMSLTQEQLGKKMGRNTWNISRIETNKVPISDDDIYAFAKALNSSPAVIIAGDGVQENKKANRKIDLEDISNQLKQIRKLLEEMSIK